MQIYKNEDHGKMESSMLSAKYHFSFFKYYNPNRQGYHNLKVINDDRINPNKGFDMHGHQDMEIVTYIIDGAISHKDNFSGNHDFARVPAGGLQYMSAGTGIMHAEMNFENKITRVLQIWVLPRAKGTIPRYGQYIPTAEDTTNTMHHLVSDLNGAGCVQINQNIDMYKLLLEPDQEFTINPDNRPTYTIIVTGNGQITNHDNQQQVNEGDAIEGAETIRIKNNGTEILHLLIINQ